MGIDVLIEDESMTAEEKEQAKAIFALAAPVIPNLVEMLNRLDPSIIHGVLVCWRTDGTIAVTTGNSPPSVTVPVLKQMIEEMSGGEGQKMEIAFADQRGKAN